MALGDFFKQFDPSPKGIGRFVTDHPFITAAVVVGGGYLVAGALAPAAATASAALTATEAGFAAGSLPAAGTTLAQSQFLAGGATALPGAGISTAGVVAPTIGAEGVVPTAGKGMLSKAGGFLFGSPTRMQATAIGAQTIGSYLQSKQASDDAELAREDAIRMREEDREFMRERDAAALASRRVRFARTPGTRFTTRGALGRAIPASPEPVAMSSDQALKLRREGRL